MMITPYLGISGICALSGIILLVAAKKFSIKIWFMMFLNAALWPVMWIMIILWLLMARKKC